MVKATGIVVWEYDIHTDELYIADEITKFHIEKLKLQCRILQNHIISCGRRLDEINQRESNDENQMQRYT